MNWTPKKSDVGPSQSRTLARVWITRAFGPGLEASQENFGHRFHNSFTREEGGGRHEGTTVRSMLLRGGMEVRSLERTSIQPRAAILAAVRFEQKTGAKTTKK